MGPNKDSEEATKPPQSPLSREKLNFCEENVGSSDFLLCKAKKLLLFSVMWNTAGLLSGNVTSWDLLWSSWVTCCPLVQRLLQIPFKNIPKPYLEKYIPGENLWTYGGNMRTGPKNPDMSFQRDIKI